MRKLLFCSVVLLAGAGAAVPAFAGDSALGPNDEIVPVVAPGEQIGIACDVLAVAQTNSDVRVVLTISAQPGETPGYNKVLATNQKLAKGSVHVVVPNTPDIADHTYDLSVYVVDKKGAQSCDAGHVRVAQRMSQFFSHQTDREHS